MIAKMIAEFAENSAEGGKFLISVNLAESEEDDYMGDEWVDKVFYVDSSFMIAHSPEWIEEESAKHGLTVEYGDELFGQRWVLITNSMSAGGPR